MAATIPHDEQRRLIAAIQAGENADRAFERLLAGFNRMLWQIVRKFTRGDEEQGEELHQVALIAFHHAVVRFDLSRDVKLITYAYTAVFNAIRTELVRQPGENCIAECRRAKIVSMDNAHDGDGNTLAEILDDGGGGDPARDVERIEKEEFNRELVQLALSRLDYRLRAVVERRQAGDTLKAVGAELGVTKERVRQLETMAHAELHRILADPSTAQALATRRKLTADLSRRSVRVFLSGRVRRKPSITDGVRAALRYYPDGASSGLVSRYLSLVVYQDGLSYSHAVYTSLYWMVRRGEAIKLPDGRYQSAGKWLISRRDRPRRKRVPSPPKDKFARRRHRARERGLCVVCGRPSEPYYLCEPCRKKKNAYRSSRRQVKRVDTSAA